MSKQRAELKGLFCDCNRPALDRCPKCGKLVCEECSSDNVDCHDDDDRIFDERSERQGDLIAMYRAEY